MEAATWSQGQVAVAMDSMPTKLLECALRSLVKLLQSPLKCQAFLKSSNMPFFLGYVPVTSVYSDRVCPEGRAQIPAPQK